MAGCGPIIVTFKVRKPFLWACSAVIAFAKMTALFTHPHDFDTHENIANNATAICSKIMGHRWAIKIL